MQLPEKEFRKAARLVLLDEENRILLFEHRHPDGSLLWATPGGGLEHEETYEQAAQREAFEELGVEQATFEYLWEATREFSWGHRLIRQQEAFFLVRGAQVLFGEKVREFHREEGIEQVRWWSLAELESSSDPIYPRDLAARVRGCR